MKLAPNMLYSQGRNIHRPLHFFQENSIYFLTGRTFREEHFFNTKEKKQILLNILSQAIERFSISLYAWVILDNHYHLEFGFVPRSRRGMTPLAALPDIEHNSASAVTPNSDRSAITPLARFVNMLHSKSTVFLNKLDYTPGRKIWYQYWDRCIRNEKDFWKHFNYIHNNPIKHRYVKNLDDLSNYQFSSFNHYLRKQGREWTNDCFSRYPIVDFSAKGDRQ